MKKKFNKNITNFSDFIQNVKIGEIRSLRNDILSVCNITSTTYSKWMRGIMMPRKDKQCLINKIANNYGYNDVY